ncbi:MAG: hypothetical protein FJ125_16230, partial [Deltaproteobacteria bacterium]|nr:hypothetical protein [Deltaproteobacteria bacterium]
AQEQPRAASPLAEGWDRDEATGEVAGQDPAGTIAAAPPPGLDRDRPGAAVEVEADRGAAAGAADGAADGAAGMTRLPLAGFARGARAGTCLHEVLERHDFAERDPARLLALLQEQLARHGFDGERWCGPLAEGLSLALATRLDPALGELCLRDVARQDRFDELSFDLPVAGGLEPECAQGALVTPRSLARLFDRWSSPAVPPEYPEQLGRLPFVPLRGFLTGALDLVFRHGDRWYLVDYKSNFLGDHPACYRAEQLRQEMARKHYYLQYHLYLVALIRYLSWKLPDFKYDLHFGGVYYLFLRGMIADPRRDSGVFRDRPPAGLVQGLDELLARGGGPTPERPLAGGPGVVPRVEQVVRHDPAATAWSGQAPSRAAEAVSGRGKPVQLSLPLDLPPVLTAAAVEERRARPPGRLRPGGRRSGEAGGGRGAGGGR